MCVKITSVLIFIIELSAAPTKELLDLFIKFPLPAPIIERSEFCTSLFCPAIMADLDPRSIKLKAPAPIKESTESIVLSCPALINEREL